MFSPTHFNFLRIFNSLQEEKSIWGKFTDWSDKTVEKFADGILNAVMAVGDAVGINCDQKDVNNKTVDSTLKINNAVAKTVNNSDVKGI